MAVFYFNPSCIEINATEIGEQKSVLERIESEIISITDPIQ